METYSFQFVSLLQTGVTQTFIWEIVGLLHSFSAENLGFPSTSIFYFPTSFLPFFLLFDLTYLIESIYYCIHLFDHNAYNIVVREL